MAEDEDPGKRSKDNTDPTHKPENVPKTGHAPSGHLGTSSLLPNGLGLGSTHRSRTRPEQGKATHNSDQADKDSRSVFHETGDKDVDRHYERSGDRMIPKSSRDHPEHPDHGKPKLEGPRISQSDYAKAFREARDAQTARAQTNQQGRKGRGPELE